MAEAWTLTITYPSLSVGFGTSVNERMGDALGDGFVSWRAFIDSAILKNAQYVVIKIRRID